MPAPLESAADACLRAGEEGGRLSDARELRAALAKDANSAVTVKAVRQVYVSGVGELPGPASITSAPLRA